MRIKNADMPAMPLLLDTKVTASGGSVADDYFEGLTKREMMAMHMMAALMGQGGEFDSARSQAECAIEASDALLAELGRTK